MIQARLNAFLNKKNIIQVFNLTLHRQRTDTDWMIGIFFKFYDHRGYEISFTAIWRNNV